MNRRKERNHRVIHWIQHFCRAISTKMFLILLLLILPFNFMAIRLSNAATAALVDQAKMSVENMMENHIAELEHRMDNALYLLWNMRNVEPDGLTLAKQMQGEDYYAAKGRLYFKFYNTISMTDGLDGYFIYMDDIEDILIWENPPSARVTGEQFVREEVVPGDRGRWHLNQIDGRQTLCIFIRVNRVTYGGWIYLDTVLDNLKADVQYEQADFSITETSLPVEEQGEMFLSTYIPRGNYFINCRLDRMEILGNLSSVQMFLNVGAFATLLLLPVLYLVIQHLLLYPLQTLVNAQRRLETGDLDYRISQNANSVEYEHTFQSFNEMAENIKNLKVENYEKELARQTMELKNLQLQIRPHFLLNTFNLIYTLAKRHEEGAIQNIILYLSEYFRYLFRSGQSLELFEKEQHLIEGYVEMVKVRYPGSLEIEYSYDPEIDFVRVPPLLLHNFVENIVMHVVKQDTLTNISIVGQYEDKKVSFMVMDDGPGLSPEQVEELDQMMRTERKDGEHIGFSNSLRRIKYFYGEEADIILSSEPGEGTCVTIQFPYDLEVSDDTFDRE